MGEYLFLDVEWYKSGKENRIIQMANRICDEKYQLCCQDFKIVRPNDLSEISESKLGFLHLSKSELMGKKPLELLLPKFVWKMNSEGYKVIVVWTKAAYDLFVEELNNLGLSLKKHTLVVLQDRVSKRMEIEDVAFELALRFHKIRHKKALLHTAKHDATYLMDLFVAVEKNASKHMLDPKSYVYAKGSNVLHKPDCGCRYEKRIALEKREYTNGTALFLGKRLCQECSKKEQSNRPIPKRKKQNRFEKITGSRQFSEDVVAKMLKSLGLKGETGRDIVLVDTGFSRWKIHHNNENITKIYHENYAGRQRWISSIKESNQGYHKQKVMFDTLYETLKYISRHDKVSRKNGLKVKRTKIDGLFDQIEQELKDKYGTMPDCSEFV